MQSAVWDAINPDERRKAKGVVPSDETLESREQNIFPERLATLEATQEQTANQSPTDSTSGR